ncbi:MAG: ABC transporter ATP-binding protein [Nitriliruptoraceae bacterium]
MPDQALDVDTDTRDGLVVQGLTVRFDDTVAVDDVDVHVDSGERLVILGPSGCGKSSLLRAIAGIVEPRSGRITLDGRRLDGLPPHRRGVGLMFQDHALFVHRNVADNVAFGLRMQRQGPAQVQARVEEVLELVDLGAFADRDVTELSGGEQQRVALARSLAPRPRLLMLDEPLGSLDRALRARLLEDLAGLLATLETTVVYVTHDQDEALRLADRIAVMRDGRLVQVGAPEEIWRQPADEFVARFIGLDQLLDATLDGQGVHTAFGVVPAGLVAPTVDTTSVLRLVLLADAVRLADGPTASGASEQIVVGTAISRRIATDHLQVTVRTDEGVVLRVPVWRGPGPAPGDRTEIVIDWASTHLVAADTRD